MARPRRRRTRTGTGPLVSCARFAVRHTHTVDRRRHARALSLSLSQRASAHALSRAAHLGGRVFADASACPCAYVGGAPCRPLSQLLGVLGLRAAEHAEELVEQRHVEDKVEDEHARARTAAMPHGRGSAELARSAGTYPQRAHPRRTRVRTGRAAHSAPLASRASVTT